MQTNISTGYEPRPFQAWLHANRRRFNTWVMHRRFGKTVCILNEMIDSGLKVPHHNPQLAYIAPTYGQAKRIAWDYLKMYTQNFTREVNESELRVDIKRDNDRVRLMLLGAENPTSILGMYQDGVAFDEYAQMTPSIWTRVVRPMLSDRKGWAIFSGTPQGMNHFHDILEVTKAKEREGSTDWKHAILKASQTGVIDQQELDDARQTMSDEEYMAEFECSFTAGLVGSYFGKELELAEKEGRIGKVPFDESVPVETSWDIGIDDTTVIWFWQQVRREIHFIDYVEDSGRGLEYYARVLRDKTNLLGYNYYEHIFPHDFAAREFGSGKSRQETWRDMRMGKYRIVPKQSIEDRIHASRVLLRRSFFDQERCARGIHALRNYQKKWDEKAKIFSSKPMHNWASHASDAFGCGALGLQDIQVRENLIKLPRQADNEFNIFD